MVQSSIICSTSKWRLVVVPIMAAALSACHQQYRLLDDQLVPLHPPLPSRSKVPVPLPMIERIDRIGDVPVETAYIEFKDQGCSFDPASAPPLGSNFKYQLDETIKLIRDRKPAHVVLYVHGWNNNASEESADVARFRFALSFLGRKFEQTGPVLGIFIGWRGGTFKGGVLGPFTFVTYWSRKQGAKRVAEGRCRDAPEALPKVIDRLLAESTAARSDRRFYAIGHSFGARVLEGALEKSSYAEGLFDAIRKKQPTYIPPIDLVLLINPATDSMKTELFLKKAHRLMQQNNSDFLVLHPGFDEVHCRTHPDDRVCKPYPLMVEMSSVGDYLTGGVMPVANILNFVPPFLFLSAPSARVFSAPFSPWLRTHSVTACGPPSAQNNCPAKDKDTEFDFQLPASPSVGNPPVLAWEQVKRLPGARQQLVWIMKTDTKIARNHGDVWNGNVAEMMFALIDPTGPQENRASVIQHASPPPVLSKAAPSGEVAPLAVAPKALQKRPVMVLRQSGPQER